MSESEKMNTVELSDVFVIAFIFDFDTTAHLLDIWSE